MSKYAYSYLLQNRPFETLPAKPRRRREFSIPLIELLRPDSYWPQPLSIEQAFELMRWMVETGSAGKYSSQLRWGTCGPIDLLSATSGIGYHYVIPVESVDDLRKRFHFAVLARPSSEGQEQWREDFNINPLAVVTIKRPTYRPFEGAAHLGWRSERDIADALKALCSGSRGERMAVSLNSFHKDTVNWLHGVSVAISASDGFSFSLTYGENPVDGHASRWAETIARSRKGESFLDTMARARDVFDCIVHGKPNLADTSDLMEHQYIGVDFISDQIAAIQTAGRAA